MQIALAYFWQKINLSKYPVPIIGKTTAQFTGFFMPKNMKEYHIILCLRKRTLSIVIFPIKKDGVRFISKLQTPNSWNYLKHRMS